MLKPLKAISFNRLPAKARGAGTAGSGAGSGLARASASLKNSLPRGRTLPAEAWEARHRAMLLILWVHVAVLPVFSMLRGFSVEASIGSVAPIALAGVAGMLRAPGRRARSIAVVFGLLTSSAVLVHAWNGQIEAHFHFFVMIAVLALYEDWLPFGIAIGYVVLEHGAMGAIAPRSVYSHGGNPWAWAAIHGFFVLGATAASVVTWRLNEDMRERLDSANRDVAETSKRFRQAFESDVSGMAVISPEGRYIQVNRALSKITGYTEQELLGSDFSSVTHPDDLAKSIEQGRSLLSGEVDSVEAERRYVHRDGREVWVQLGVSAVRDADGAVLYLIAQMHDITARRQFQEELSHRALHDVLTGLPNRALFLDRLGHALVRARGHSSQIVVLFLDLDHFKLANDGLGHPAGDAVLVEAARRLSTAARADDTVARFGGDEFAILCEDAGEDEARLVAERILAAFASPFVHEGQGFQQGVSIGMRVSGRTPATPELMLRDADLALYTAKERGGARAETFDPAVHTGAIDRIAIEQELQLALGRDEFCLHYQPQVDLESGRIVAVEALLRWWHPQRGLVPPDDFIYAAERSGLIVPIGAWVMRTACSQIASWRNAGIVQPGVRVAVNVSARQLSRPELPETVASALASAGLEPGALCLEITESAVIEDPAVALANVDALKRQGVFIALDDFGVGFSSLSHIRSLPPVDTIKIDKSFIAGLGRSDSDGAVITAVMGIARSLGLSTVAEGIETADQLLRLRLLGCSVGQGFHFSRPLPPALIEGLLAEGRVEADGELTMVAS
jgi:diguanylate cyclase (GGDEF)-like protein/PAS domain S-box-containing protein